MLQWQRHGFGVFQPSVIRPAKMSDEAWLEHTKSMLLPLEHFRAEIMYAAGNLGGSAFKYKQDVV